MMRGGMGNMNNMMKQMQKMQKEMAKAQEELGEKTVEGTAGGGMITVIANGHKQILEVKVKRSCRSRRYRNVTRLSFSCNE